MDMLVRVWLEVDVKSFARAMARGVVKKMEAVGCGLWQP
jgi:hypothetical protein